MLNLNFLPDEFIFGMLSKNAWNQKITPTLGKKIVKPSVRGEGVIWAINKRSRHGETIILTVCPIFQNCGCKVPELLAFKLKLSSMTSWSSTHLEWPEYFKILLNFLSKNVNKLWKWSKLLKKVKIYAKKNTINGIFINENFGLKIFKISTIVESLVTLPFHIHNDSMWIYNAIQHWEAIKDQLLTRWQAAIFNRVSRAWHAIWLQMHFA